MRKQSQVMIIATYFNEGPKYFGDVCWLGILKGIWRVTARWNEAVILQKIDQVG